MSRVEAAAGMDRLPWLPDEPQPRPVKRRGNPVVPWAAAAILAVAAGGFWLGTRSAEPASTLRCARSGTGDDDRAAPGTASRRTEGSTLAARAPGATGTCAASPSCPGT